MSLFSHWQISCFRMLNNNYLATRSCNLAWKIPWTEETGRLQSMGSQRVGHNWATSLSLFTFMHWRRKWQPTPVFLPVESHRLWAAIYGVAQRWTWLKRLSSSSSRVLQGLPWWPNSRQSTCNAGVMDSVPRSGRSLGGEKGNSLKYSCLGNAMDRGVWWAIVHGVARDAHDLAIKPPPGSYIFKYSVSESEVAQSCPTLWDPMDCSLSGSVHGIFQARVLEWIAISFSRGSSQPRNWTWVSRTAGRRFTVWATREAPSTQYLTIIIYGMLASFQWALQNIFCFMVNMRVSLTRMSTVQCLYVLFLLR